MASSSLSLSPSSEPAPVQSLGTSEPSRRAGRCPTWPLERAREARIRVAVRVRPVPPQEHTIIEVGDNSTAIAVRREAATGGNEFLSSQQGRTEERTFDRVFGPDATQEEVFSWSCQPLVSSAVREGRNATVFVYGATGAGKTHTMFGERRDEGLIHRAVREVFKAASEQERRPLEAKVAFLEIYNESVRDLLAADGGACRLLEDAHRGLVRVQNLREEAAETAEDALRLLTRGLARRRVEATAANARSSRSHVVFSLTLEHVATTEGRGGLSSAGQGEAVRSLHSRICLIDLAGSERAILTQNTGQALIDGAKINRSLLALVNCIDALSAHRRPPYRDSKLTLLLKESLTSDCLVSMIANVHPGCDHFEDSSNTLKYAGRASLVKAPVLVRGAAHFEVPPPPALVRSAGQEARPRPGQVLPALDVLEASRPCSPASRVVTPGARSLRSMARSDSRCTTQSGSLCTSRSGSQCATPCSGSRCGLRGGGSVPAARPPALLPPLADLASAQDPHVYRAILSSLCSRVGRLEQESADLRAVDQENARMPHSCQGPTRRGQSSSVGARRPRSRPRPRGARPPASPFAPTH